MTRDEIEAAAARHGLRVASALPSHSDGEWEILIGPIAVYLDMDTGEAFPMRRATGIGIVPRRLPSLDEALAAVRRDLEACAAALVTQDDNRRALDEIAAMIDAEAGRRVDSIPPDSDAGACCNALTLGAAPDLWSRAFEDVTNELGDAYDFAELMRVNAHHMARAAVAMVIACDVAGIEYGDAMRVAMLAANADAIATGRLRARVYGSGDGSGDGSG